MANLDRFTRCATCGVILTTANAGSVDHEGTVSLEPDEDGKYRCERHSHSATRGAIDCGEDTCASEPICDYHASPIFDPAAAQVEGGR